MSKMVRRNLAIVVLMTLLAVNFGSPWGLLVDSILRGLLGAVLINLLIGPDEVTP